MNYPEEYWHCEFRFNSVCLDDQYHSVFNLNFHTLKKEYLIPYFSSSFFMLGGQKVEKTGIKGINIVQTERNLGKLYFASIIQNDYDIFDSSRGVSNIYTNRILNDLDLLGEIGAPEEPFVVDNNQVNKEDYRQITLREKNNNHKVFVVHGREMALVDKVSNCLRKMKLEPIVLAEQLDGGKTIIEKFEDNSDVSYAVVLLTPDDVGRYKNDSDLSYRVRQNVVFEHGYFCGKLGRDRVCALLVDKVEIQSDLQGVIYKSVDLGGAWRYELGREMQRAGLPVDLNDL